MYELMSVLSLAAIAIFLLFPYNSFRIEKVRQHAFALRDELFDEARKGNIAFDSQAYMATRSLLNGLIRFSHRISLSRIIAFRCVLTNDSIAGASDGLTRAMNASTKVDRELCLSFIRRANILVAQHVLESPLVLIFVLPPVIGIVLSRVGFNVAAKIVTLCKQQFADFDRIAFKEGQA